MHRRLLPPFDARAAAAVAIALALGASGVPSRAAAPAVEDATAQRVAFEDTLAQRGTFEDTLAQRVVACTGCHGPAGRAAADGYYPRIAGKPAGYLYNQLRNFRDGRRQYAPMTTLLGALGGPTGDLYLLEIASHFASLDLPYAASASPRADPAAAARGEALVRRGDSSRQLPACAQCHGDALMGVAPAVPGLLGLPRDYLNAQLGAWRSGHRQAEAPDCMAQVARALAPADIAALSGWLAAQPVPAGSKPARATAAALPLPCGGVPVVGSVEAAPK